jgi:general secretion pathway protein C
MKLHRIARRYFWLAHLSVLAVLGFVHAQALTAIARVGIAATPGGVLDAPLRVRAPPPQSLDSRTAQTILARNAFDSRTGPLDGPRGGSVAPSVEDAAASDGDPMRAPPCEGVKVIAIASSADPDWSLASFVPTITTGDPRPLLRRRGGDVSGKTVELIAPDRAWLSSGSRRCQVVMFQPSVVAVAETKLAEKTTPRDALTQELAVRVRRSGPRSFAVDRSVVEKLLENPALLMGHAQIAPGAHGAALRMVGIKPESLLGVLGLESGDELTTINGFDVTDPEKALSAYGRLRGAPHLTLAVTRKGATTNLDYDIE